MSFTQARHRRSAGRLPASAAFVLQASVVVFFLAASSAPTPLYALYQARWGFSPITTARPIAPRVKTLPSQTIVVTGSV